MADQVLVVLFEWILKTPLGAGMRLPPERALAEQIDASRVSVRAAMQRLAQWGVLSIRHGSGAEVMPTSRWSAAVLPAVMRYELAANSPRLPDLVWQSLRLRRGVVLDLVEEAAPHLGPGMLDQARAAVGLAWASRADAAAFATADREVLPLVLQAAGRFPSLWLINSLAEPYLQTLAVMAPRARPPRGYRDSHERMFAALERRDGAAARDVFSAFIDEVDKCVIRALPAGLRRRVEKHGETARRLDVAAVRVRDPAAAVAVGGV